MFSDNKDTALELRKSAAVGNLCLVKKYCNAQTINTNSSNGNTSLHWALKNKHWHVAEYLLTQENIDIYLKNAEGKKAADCLFKDKELSITIEDLKEINAYVYKVIPFGAPNWEKRQFPDQDSPLAATWNKKDPNFYRIDILERFFFSVVAPIKKKMILENLNEKNSEIIVRLIHSLLSEVIGVGRCDEQIAVVFSRFILLNKQGKLEWMTGLNEKSAEGHNFILVHREGTNIKEPKSWKHGLLCDPMARKEEKFDNGQSLMPYLEKIILDENVTHRSIDFNVLIKLELPLTMEQHQMIVDSLKVVYDKFDDFFSRRLNDYVTQLKSEYPLIKKPEVKTWITSFLNLLDKKISAHEEFYNKLKLIKYIEALSPEEIQPIPPNNFSKS